MEGSQRAPRRRNDSPQVALSKLLSYLLRHGAEREGISLETGGFARVAQLFDRHRPLQKYTLDDIKEVVRDNDKKRFAMKRDTSNGEWLIRANQGHSINNVGIEYDEIISSVDIPVVIHGTYFTKWKKICESGGLSRMKRTHIHFAVGEPGSDDVISGMRRTCDLYIYIDSEKAMRDGFKFYSSENNVILCAGDERGILPMCYFKEAVHIGKTMRQNILNNQ